MLSFKASFSTLSRTKGAQMTRKRHAEVTTRFSRDVLWVWSPQGDWGIKLDTVLALSLVLLYVCSVSATSSNSHRQEWLELQEAKNRTAGASYLQSRHRVKVSEHCFDPAVLPFAREESARTVAIVLVTLVSSLVIILLDLWLLRRLTSYRPFRRSGKHVTFSKTSLGNRRMVKSSVTMEPVFVEYIPTCDLEISDGLDTGSIASDNSDNPPYVTPTQEDRPPVEPELDDLSEVIS